MTFRLSSRALAFQESAIRKLDAVVAERSETVAFHRVNIGQPDVPTPPELLEAIRSFQPKVVRYGPASGLMACREAAAAYHGAWQPSLDPMDIAISHGGSEALLFAFAATCDFGDEVLAPEPFYTNYNGFAKIIGVKIAPIATTLAEGFALPSDEELDSYVTDKTRAFVFSNPANPTGKIYSRAELERLSRWTQKRGLWLISDEVYRRIWFDQPGAVPPPSVLELSTTHDDNLICIDSISKSYSACGARLGMLISRNKTLMERVERLGQARLGPQPLAQHIAIAAFGLPESYYEETRHRYARRIGVLLDGLSKIEGVTSHRPDGAFYLMCSLPVSDSEDFARFLASEFEHEGESLVVAPAPGFYASNDKGRNEIRLAAVLEESRLQRVAELLGIALNVYQERSGEDD